jgi:hypothetical protein
MTSAPQRYGAGTYCEVSGMVYRVDENVGGGTNITIDDGTGSTVLRVWDSMLLRGDSLLFPPDTVSRWYTLKQLEGHIVNFRGPSSTYNGDFQMLLGYRDDINITSADSAAALKTQALRIDVPNRPFAPDLGQKLKISYDAPNNGGAQSHVRLRIFDLRGHMVWSYDKNYGGPNSIEWDGRDNTNSIVPLGTYILHIEYITNGSSSTDMKPIVVGTKL